MSSSPSEGGCSAIDTALQAANDIDLRHPFYCEENVWRLAYRRLHHHQTLQSNFNDASTECRYHVVFISNEGRCCPFFYQKAAKKQHEPCFWDYHVILVCSTTSTIVTTEDGTVDEEHRKNKNEPCDVTRNKNTTTTHQVLDMDSWLPYPCSLARYLNDTFQHNFEGFIRQPFREKYAPRFRMLRAELYLQYFFSDRMHMYNQEKKSWSAPPPIYHCIMEGSDDRAQNGDTDKNTDGRDITQDNEMNCYNCAHSQKSNLQKYIQMNKQKTLCISSQAASTSIRLNENDSKFGNVFTLDEFEKLFFDN